MKIVLATNNAGKIREIKEFLGGFEVVSFAEILPKIEPEESGESFAQNALIKARAAHEALACVERGEFVVLADDSGISVEALGFAPGIYSARFSGVGASDEQNRVKLIAELNARGVEQSSAFYTAAIALVGCFGGEAVLGGGEAKPCRRVCEGVTHGFMHGRVINSQRGTNGFGYDPLFVPNGFSKTLGELDAAQKESLSHRTQALRLAKILLNSWIKSFATNH